MHRTLRPILLGILALALASSCGKKSKADRMKALAGMYKLLIIEKVDSSSGQWKEETWASGGDSYIMYDGLGHMAVEITPKDYKNFTWITENQTTDMEVLGHHVDTLSEAESKAALRKFATNYVYFANVRLNDTADIVSHDRVSGTYPVIWGTAVHRTFRFSGDTLILQILNGNRRLKWLRMK